MKDILIVLLLIVIVILVFGAVNQDNSVDFDYIGGTWKGAPMFGLAAIGAGVVFVVGLATAAVARQRVVGDRRKLEKELEQIYARLRAAEKAGGIQAPERPSLSEPAAAEPSIGATSWAAGIGGVAAADEETLALASGPGQKPAAATQETQPSDQVEEAQPPSLTEVPRPPAAVEQTQPPAEMEEAPVEEAPAQMEEAEPPAISDEAKRTTEPPG